VDRHSGASNFEYQIAEYKENLVGKVCITLGAPDISIVIFDEMLEI
jgi:hypothetical protein